MKIFSLILFTLMAVAGFGQRICISNPEQRILYSDLPSNPLDVLVEGYAYDSLIVTTNNGKIENPDTSTVGFYKHCYWINQLINGTAAITVKGKKAGKINTIGTFYFKVEYWPNVKFKIASGKHLIKKNELAEQSYVRAEYENTDMDKKLTIDSFSIVAFRDRKVFFYKKCYSNELDEATKTFLKTLKEGDQILFFDIWANDEHPARKLEDLEITITE